MATKKEKRQAGIERHERQMAELKRSNAEALKKEQDRREYELRKAWQQNHDKRHNWKNRIKECPICRDIVKANQAPAKHVDDETLESSAAAS